MNEHAKPTHDVTTLVPMDVYATFYAFVLLDDCLRGFDSSKAAKKMQSY